jgi:hypothetical protein
VITGSLHAEVTVHVHHHGIVLDLDGMNLEPVRLTLYNEVAVESSRAVIAAR